MKSKNKSRGYNIPLEVKIARSLLAVHGKIVEAAALSPGLAAPGIGVPWKIEPLLSFLFISPSEKTFFPKVFSHRHGRVLILNFNKS